MASNPQPCSSIEKENLLNEKEKKKSLFSMRLSQQPIRLGRLFEVVLIHAVALYGFLVCIHQMNWLTMVWGTFIAICCIFGVTAGVHRLWSHRSYKVKLHLKIILLICYMMAGMNSVRQWVADHRMHHKYSDTDGDPHNSSRGFWFSHVGWLVQNEHPEVTSKRDTVDISDITDDPLLEFEHRYHAPLKWLFCYVLPTVIPIWLWNEDWFYSVIAMLFMRYMVNLNAIFSVNSFAHIWGWRPYNKQIKATESAVLGFFALGEGWHNYHHTFPWDYRASEFGVGKYNLTTTLIDFFQKIGWVYDVKIASDELIKKTIDKYGDGSHITVNVPAEYADQIYK